MLRRHRLKKFDRISLSNLIYYADTVFDINSLAAMKQLKTFMKKNVLFHWRGKATFKT